MVRRSEMIEKIMLSIAVLLFVGLISAGCIQDLITPGYLDPDVIVINGGYEPVNPFYTSLFDAIRLKRQIINKFKYSVDALDYSISNSMELKDTVFNPNNGLGLLIAGMPAFAIGWLGLSKPSDKKKLNGNTNG